MHRHLGGNVESVGHNLIYRVAIARIKMHVCGYDTHVNTRLEAECPCNRTQQTPVGACTGGNSNGQSA